MTSNSLLLSGMNGCMSCIMYVSDEQTSCAHFASRSTCKNNNGSLFVVLYILIAYNVLIIL